MGLLVVLLSALLLLTLGVVAVLVILMISRRSTAVNRTTNSDESLDHGTSNPWEEAGKRITCDNDEPE